MSMFRNMLIHCLRLAILDGLDAWPIIPSQYGPDGKWGSIDP